MLTILGSWVYLTFTLESEVSLMLLFSVYTLPVYSPFFYPTCTLSTVHRSALDSLLKVVLLSTFSTM